MIYTHVAAGLLGAAVAAIGAWQIQDWRYNARIALMQESHAKIIKEASEAARSKEQALNAAREKAEETYALEKRKSDAAVRSTRAELDRLRHELYAIPAPGPSQNPATSGRANAATVERKLLGECAAALVEVAADADFMAAQLIGLHAYVRNVCTATK